MKKVLLLAIVASLSISSTAHAGKWGKLADRVTNAEQEIDNLQEYTDTLIPAIQETLYNEGVIRAENDKNLMNQINKTNENIFFNTQKINENSNRITELENSLSMFTAMANLTDDNISVAIGTYGNTTSLAMGTTFKPHDQVRVKLTASTNFDTFTAGAGVGYNFK